MANVDTVLGIDIGSSSIKAAMLIKGASGYAAQMLAIEPVPGADIETNEFDEAEKSEAVKLAERRERTLSALQSLIQSARIRRRPIRR